MKITLTLTPEEIEQSGLDEEDLAEAVKDLVDQGIYFDEINVELVIEPAL
jgi:hypothetical protein